MSDLRHVDEAGERSRPIGGRAAMLAYTVFSSLLAVVIVSHLLTNGFAALGGAGFEIPALVIGWMVYAGGGLYFARTT